MTKRVSTVYKTISSIRMVESISISLSLTLGPMDSRDSSRSSTMDTYSVGNIGNTISMVDRGSMMGSIANMSYTIAKMMPRKAIQSISVSSSKSCSTNQQSYPDHVVWRMILLE